MAGSVFGLGAQLDVEYTTWCFMGIIAFTIMFELFDEHLYAKLDGSIYLEMMQKVYKELTILGFISFGVFMAINTNSVGHGAALVAFEFAHIVVFFSAMFFILQSIMMMFLSKRLKMKIDHICSAPIPELLNQYHSRGMREYTSTFHKRPYKHIDLRNQMEMKLLQHFFIEQYALEGFDFASYLHACYDKSFLEVCEVSLGAVRNAELKLLNIAGCDTTFQYEDRLEIIQDGISRKEQAVLDATKDNVEAVKALKIKEAEQRSHLRERSIRIRDMEEMEYEAKMAEPGILSSITSKASVRIKEIKEDMVDRVDEVLHRHSQAPPPVLISPSNRRRTSLAADDFYTGLQNRDVLAELEMKREQQFIQEEDYIGEVEGKGADDDEDDDDPEWANINEEGELKRLREEKRKAKKLKKEQEEKEKKKKEKKEKEGVASTLPQGK
ncbi:hypothetical protein TL16_g07995 [Triparma laevis f. inornata]|uniref:Uncharacterized protein n=1 Tax=Triparma laevis f. inornata TaxID=1714386 RepID=A0A9W7EHD0_9STRA|nr:hypothetical protein TL16_g07995 [Triparma laevis f. inornata]